MGLYHQQLELLGKDEFKGGNEGLHLWRQGGWEVELEEILELRGVL
jgi:hypothetical protein